MKKTLLAFTTIVALLFASCSNPAGSSNDDPADNTGTSSDKELPNNTLDDSDTPPKENEPTKYTLSFDANFPFETGSKFIEGYKFPIRNSTFVDWDGKAYYYDNDFKGENIKQESITTDSFIILGESPYTYSMWCYNTERTGVGFVARYKVDHYATHPLGFGNVYYPGDIINLTQDTTLYCIYSFWYDAEHYPNESTTNTSNNATVTLESKIAGTWTITDSSYSGILTLNADSTGHFVSYLNNTTTHDFDFKWSVSRENSDSSTELILKFSSTKPYDNNEGGHRIKMNSNFTTMTFSEWLSFGMPYTTVWKKQ